ncbi:hypothetical protein LSAT2_016477 [Lamellibrachia satsuma]|nr:hypothetical protein LSAT2_016477 [Lamellibrachia satsuma]
MPHARHIWTAILIHLKRLRGLSSMRLGKTLLLSTGVVLSATNMATRQIIDTHQWLRRPASFCPATKPGICGMRTSCVLLSRRNDPVNVDRVCSACRDPHGYCGIFMALTVSAPIFLSLPALLV